MPRILPRLLKRLSQTAHLQQTVTIHPGLRPRKSRKSLRKHVPSVEFVHPNERARSILLDPVNPVFDHDLVHHKSLPPKPFIQHGVPKKVDDDVERVMTEEELQWWSSPYRMFLSILYAYSCLIIHSENVIIWTTAMFRDIQLSTHWYLSLPGIRSLH